MGIKTILRPLQGVQKQLSPCFGGLDPTKLQKKHFSPLRWSIQHLKKTFSEFTQRNWLNDMGIKTILRPLQGVQKRFSPVLGGLGPFKVQEKPILTLKMVDSALENKHFLNLHKTLA